MTLSTAESTMILSIPPSFERIRSSASLASSRLPQGKRKPGQCDRHRRGGRQGHLLLRPKMIKFTWRGADSSKRRDLSLLRRDGQKVHPRKLGQVGGKSGERKRWLWNADWSSRHKEEIEKFRAAILADPRGHIAQPVVLLSRSPPIATGSPRVGTSICVRTFFVAKRRASFPGAYGWPCAKARRQFQPGRGSKDTWVIDENGEPELASPSQSQSQSQSQGQHRHSANRNRSRSPQVQ